MQSETLVEEFSRLVREYKQDDGPGGIEAWNLIADFAVDNAEAIEAALSTAERVAAITTDYLGCEYVSSDIANIEKIASAGTKGPTPVRYLYDKPQQPAPSVAVKALQAIANYRHHSRLDSDENAEAMEQIARTALSAQVQDVAEGWSVISNHGSVLIYCLKQNGWRKGEPVMVNDVTIRIENAAGSNHDLTDIADAIIRSLPAAPAKQEGGE